MAYNKNKKPRKVYRPRAKLKQRELVATAKRTILTVIILAMLAVILALLFNIFNQPERLVKQQVEAIASDYYETYLYPSISASAEISSSKPVTEIIGNYAKNGFDDITLHQLLLFDGERHKSSTPFLTKYCDELETRIHYYPTVPFGPTDYRVEYKYSCEF